MGLRLSLRLPMHVTSADLATSLLVAAGCSHGGTADLAGGRGIVVDDGDT